MNAEAVCVGRKLLLLLLAHLFMAVVFITLTFWSGFGGWRRILTPGLRRKQRLRGTGSIFPDMCGASQQCHVASVSLESCISPLTSRL